MAVIGNAPGVEQALDTQDLILEGNREALQLERGVLVSQVFDYPPLTPVPDDSVAGQALNSIVAGESNVTQTTINNTVNFLRAYQMDNGKPLDLDSVTSVYSMQNMADESGRVIHDIGAGLVPDNIDISEIGLIALPGTDPEGPPAGVYVSVSFIQRNANGVGTPVLQLNRIIEDGGQLVVETNPVIASPLKARNALAGQSIQPIAADVLVQVVQGLE